MRRDVRKRAIDGTIRRLLWVIVGLMWSRVVGLSHGVVNLLCGETFSFEKLDTLCKWGSLGLETTKGLIGSLRQSNLSRP